MKPLLKWVAESEGALTAVVVVILLGIFYLRNGSEYFADSSGGAYWDNMNYCKTHRDGKMKLYKQLISCREILVLRKFCRTHLNDSITIDGTIVPCDRFLGVDDDYSPYDSY